MKSFEITSGVVVPEALLEQLMTSKNEKKPNKKAMDWLNRLGARAFPNELQFVIRNKGEIQFGINEKDDLVWVAALFTLPGEVSADLFERKFVKKSKIIH